MHASSVFLALVSAPCTMQRGYVDSATASVLSPFLDSRTVVIGHVVVQRDPSSNSADVPIRIYLAEGPSFAEAGARGTLSALAGCLSPACSEGSLLDTIRPAQLEVQAASASTEATEYTEVELRKMTVPVSLCFFLWLCQQGMVALRLL